MAQPHSRNHYGLLHSLLPGWVCLLLPLFAVANPLPEFDARYELRYESFRIGEAHYRLTRQQDHFLYASNSQPSGLASWFRKDRIQEQSLWTLHEGAIRPSEYHYRRTGGKKERFADLTFDWQAHRVTNSVAGQPWQMDIPAGTLDKMVVTLAVMLDLRNGKRDITYDIADGGKLKTYRFRVVGEEHVETPAGRFATLKLERVREDNKRYTALWCAPALNYLPVRIQQRESDGSLLTSNLTEASKTLATTTAPATD